jgi:capsular exopolysaccharide synthesis family protein
MDDKFERIQVDESQLMRPAYPRPLSYPEAQAYGYGYGYEDTRGPINVKAIWRTIRKRKWLIAVIALVVTCVATVEAFRNKSLYQASASIEIRSENPTIVKTADMVVYTDDTQAINTYMFMLRSRPLLKEVVARLDLDQNPKFLDVTERKSIWDAVKTIGSKLRLPQKAQAPRQRTFQHDEEVRLSPGEDEQMAPFAAVIEGSLNIDQRPEARVLTVSYTHTDPVIAAEVSNGVARAFIEHSFKSKTEKYDKASKWLDRTTRELKAKVEQAEQALADYTSEQGLPFHAAENKENLATEKFMRLHDQVQRAETDRVLKHSLYEELRAGRIAQLPEAFADLQTIELQRKLRELAVTAAQLDVKFGKNNPRVVEVRQQMAALEEQIKSSSSTIESKLKVEYERALREEQALKAILDRSKSEAAQQNLAEIKYNLLRQDVETAKGLYTEFLQKLSQAEIQLAEQNNNLALAEPAEVPGAPIGPNRLRGILTAFFFSLLAGIGLAFLIEYFDNTVKTVEDVNRYAQLPALGIIPSISASSSRRLSSRRRRMLTAASGSIVEPDGLQAGAPELVTLENRSSAAEAYRVLRTSVLLSNAENPPKTILVTSGQPGEGKTTTVVNTAISLAQLGASVLIIDCDLRKPAAHTVFGVDHVNGLSTYLSRNVELDGLIQKLQVPNLSLLPCGPIPPNPAELISSEKMKAMLQTLSERYTHILIDSPPVTNVTDPVILSRMVDGVILVVHGGKSTRDLVRRTRHELSAIGAKIFGVVLNNVDFRSAGYDDYYYYYQSYAAHGDQTKAAG